MSSSGNGGKFLSNETVPGCTIDLLTSAVPSFSNSAKICLVREPQGPDFLPI